MQKDTDCPPAVKELNLARYNEGHRENKKLRQLGAMDANDMLMESGIDKDTFRDRIRIQIDKVIKHTPQFKVRGSWLGKIDEREAMLRAWREDPYIQGFMNVLR